jgi:diguanylate cyclase
MRQTDIIDGIKDIIVGASIDASPENYEICHRYVARTDAAVCAAFEQALAQSSPISAAAFGSIREKAAPPRGQLDAAKFLGKLDVELAKIFDATADARGHSGEYSRSLDAGAADLLALGASPEAMKIIAALAAQTNSARERTEALEQSLTDASDQLSGLRQELERVKHESSSDALTSLPNRRAFDSGLI